MLKVELPSGLGRNAVKSINCRVMYSSIVALTSLTFGLGDGRAEKSTGRDGKPQPP